MEFALLGLSGIVVLIELACFVITLIRLFSKEGIGLGILGLICGIYTFWWGWKNIDKPGDRTVMTVWTSSSTSPCDRCPRAPAMCP